MEASNIPKEILLSGKEFLNKYQCYLSEKNNGLRTSKTEQKEKNENDRQCISVLTFQQSNKHYSYINILAHLQQQKNITSNAVECIKSKNNAYLKKVQAIGDQIKMEVESLRDKFHKILNNDGIDLKPYHDVEQATSNLMEENHNLTKMVEYRKNQLKNLIKECEKEIHEINQLINNIVIVDRSSKIELRGLECCIQELLEFLNGSSIKKLCGISHINHN